MFNAKKHSDFALLVFGFIAIGVIISVGIIVFQLSSKKDALPTHTQQTNSIESVADSIAKEKEVTEAYMSSMIQLATNVSSTPDFVHELSIVEQKMFEARVPKEKRDAHLLAFFTISNMKSRLDGGEQTDVIKKELISLLNDLAK